MSLVTSLSFFSFFFFLLSSVRAQIAFLDQSEMIYTSKRLFLAKNVPFGGLDKPPKTSQKWAGIGISQLNQQSSKIAIGHRLRYSHQISQTD